MNSAVKPARNAALRRAISLLHSALEWKEMIRDEERLGNVLNLSPCYVFFKFVRTSMRVHRIMSVISSSLLLPTLTLNRTVKRDEKSPLKL